MAGKTGDKEILWTPSFFILWQSQLVSTAGDAVYAIALGFWVLSVTGSTALMGALMAASTLPGILIAPFAGVLIDRVAKKRLLIFMDFIRAAAVLLLAWAAFMKLVQVWMVFVAGIILSLCGAVFAPGVQSVVPEIVKPSRVAQASSAFSAAYTGSNFVGNALGGFLYQALGAPVLFLLNGLSFLFSCLSLPFVKMSKAVRQEKPRFFQDMSEGFKFMWRGRGLRVIIIIAALSNFFESMAITLFLPLCKFTPGLGAARYGILMGCFTGGMLIGYALLSAVAIRAKNRMKIFTVTSLFFDLFLIFLVNQRNFYIMAAMFIAAGALNAVFNVILVSTLQLSTPPEVRGKVMSFVNMTAAGLTPIAMALAGVLGQVLPVRAVITACFTMGLAVTVPSYFSRAFRTYITTDYAAEIPAPEGGGTPTAGMPPE